MLRLDTSKATEAYPQRDLAAALTDAVRKLDTGSGAGGEFTGWVHLPRDYDRAEFARIQKAAEKIKKDSSVLVVIGIGGSYLGARAVIELLRSPNYNLLKKDTPDILFAGNGLSSDALNETVRLIGGRDFSINVISKSGTTTEPAVAFRIFKSLLEEKYGKEDAKARIYATTDKAKGALKGLAVREGYETFVVPDEVGGRYSVLTAVGLLPIAVAGIDIGALMAGAAEERELCLSRGAESAAAKYACARYGLYSAGKHVELLACFEPSFRFFAEWFKQLFGESEGKKNRGLFPASVEYTADLHSMGQYIQEGERLLFETVVCFDKSIETVCIPYDPENIDGLNFLAGKDLSFVAEQARRGTLLAHVDGGVPNLIINVPSRDEVSIGQLIYFFEFACGLSGYLLEVNPFDQPGVEAYKQNMFALLGKPGYEERRKLLEERL
ncbi:Glucose-6-phosphate isomerase [bioreactor metagenome]|uniref:glucose-6-phosphate isomerase n=1 Tax=bioreactor metagenome TaxID=1076179 RepID=A0A644WUJ8_9ZZZZ